MLLAMLCLVLKAVPYLFTQTHVDSTARVPNWVQISNGVCVGIEIFHAFGVSHL